MVSNQHCSIGNYVFANFTVNHDVSGVTSYQVLLHEDETEKANT